MTYALSSLGLSLVIVGSVLLYIFHDPRFGHGLMLQSFDPGRERRGARTGLALVIAGSILQIVALVIAA